MLRRITALAITLAAGAAFLPAAANAQEFHRDDRRVEVREYRTPDRDDRNRWDNREDRNRWENRDDRNAYERNSYERRANGRNDYGRSTYIVNDQCR